MYGAGPLSEIDTRTRRYLFELRAIRVWLGLKRWALAHEGRLPERLDELVPEFLSEVPVNPWEGSPLRWDKATGLIYVWADGAVKVPALKPVELRHRPVWRLNRRERNSTTDEELVIAVPFTLTPPAVPPVMPLPLAAPAVKAGPVKRKR